MSIVSKFLDPWIIKDAWWGDLQSNMGEEITNGVSEVLNELYGVLELMTVYMLCLGILIGVVLVVIAMVLD